jgi:urea transporter
MNTFIARWEAWCAGSAALRFVDINLRGVGQVMLQDNPLTGALFVAGIAWGSVAAGAPEITAAGLIAVIVGTLTAMWLRVDRAALHAGLYGYNAVLVGLALATFLAPGPLLWVYVVLGAAVSVVVTLATANTVKPLGLTALTGPFVLVAWLFLLPRQSLDPRSD